MDVNICFLAILFHLFPFEHFGALLGEFVPGNVRSAGVNLDHRNAIIYRANFRTEIATYAVFFPHYRLKSRLEFAVQLHALHIDALVGCVVAGDVAEIAMDALIRIYARNRLESQVKIAEVGNARQ